MDAQESILSEDESWQDAQRKPLRSEQADNVPDRPSAPSQFVDWWEGGVVGGGAAWREARRERGGVGRGGENRVAFDG